MKRFLIVFLFLFSLIFVPSTFAANNAFISIVNPIRGSDFWDIKDQKEETAVLGQIEILDKYTLPATWLIRFDAFDNKAIMDTLKNRTNDEKGLFLEITPSWANQANVQYRKPESWHNAGSAFLTGYERPEREKLIDAGFEKFKKTFGYYPLSVGAWWIDSYSLGYMQAKYGITVALIVADQYSTDNYQIWGQYFGTSYYPSKNNAIHPAQTEENKLDVVITQWAARDPINSYGNGVFESTFSLQANDYMDYHDLDSKYFSNLVDIYTKQKFNKFSHIVVGLENSYDWSKYVQQYQQQIQVLKEKRDSNQISVILLRDFAKWYKSTFPAISPEQLIVAEDPLGSSKKVVWYMNPYFRAGWFFNQDGSLFRDIRQYIDGEEELCFKVRCEAVNFATSATRVLDEVSFGHKWVIDPGKITDFKVEKNETSFVISYKNEAGTLRQIGFLPRDISIDGKVFSIDSAILNAIKKESLEVKTSVSEGFLEWSVFSVLTKTGKFFIFIILVIILPGLVISNKTFENYPFFLRIFISTVVGLAALTLVFYLTSLLKIKPLIFIYIFISLIFFFRFKPPSVILNSSIVILNKVKDLLRSLREARMQILNKLRDSSPRTVWYRAQNDRDKGQNKRVSWFNLIPIVIILVGTTFQVIPTFKSGLNYGFGLGFWGPNTHDGIWHMALVNQLIKSVPPDNPIYSGTVLKNYHFFYDLLIASTNYLSGLPVSDIIFRFYPILFSLMLGIGSYFLAVRLFESKIGASKAKIATIFSLYLIYFAGSFGWIVEFLRERHFGGESAFWANQAVSFNLNPPFAISLVFMIAIIYLLTTSWNRVSKIIAVLLFGTLLSFKSYTGFLVLGALFIVAVKRALYKKDFSYLLVALFSLIISAGLFLSNFQINTELLVFAPFWFIHSMVDSPDRVGWVRLSLARTSSQALGQIPKFILAEAASLLLFIVGNLGLRFLSFGLMFKIKDAFKNDALIFIFVTLIASLGIPILFIQSGNPWNTIQFFYPSLYLTALFSGVVISYLIFKLNRSFVVLLVSLFLILAPINSVVTASGYLGKTPHAYISSSELAGLQFLSTQPDGAILAYPYDEKLKQKVSEPWPINVYGSSAYVAAVSKKSTYLEDEPQNTILLTDYKKRLVASKDFFLSPNQGTKFLVANSIGYIYIPKIVNVKLDESSGLVKNIFENDAVVIYKVNND